MNLTNIFRFRKPEGTDPVNVEDFNDNFDVIDTELNKRPEKTGNASDMVTTFSQAASRANLTPGEKISVSFGKIMKYFADMKTVAFTGSYADLSNKPSIPGGAAASQAVANNCTTTAAGSVLDARQGKVLMDKANQINSDLVKVKVYVGSDGKLHFTNSGGADSVLNFNFLKTPTVIASGTTSSVTVPAGYDYVLVLGTRNTPLNYDPSISISGGTALIDLTFKGDTLTINYNGAWSTFNSMTICRLYKINKASVSVTPVLGNKESVMQMYVYAF